MGLEYTFTNESLDAIISGLKINSEDNILSIGGSGDQAFAMIANGGLVRAVDNNGAQVKFMKKRLDHLRRGYFEEFLKAEERGFADGYLDGRFNKEIELVLRDNRERYFLQGQRLETIRANLWGLVIENADITEVAKTERRFNKIYFSNALNSHYSIPEFLMAASTNLPSGGLIYVANHEYLRDISKPGRLKWSNRPEVIIDEIDDGSFLPLTLELDTDLTRKAREHERLPWKPAVYRKI